MEKCKENDVYHVSSKMLFKLGCSLDLGDTKVTLAELRNSWGRDLSNSVNCWSFIFSEMPGEFLADGPYMTREETAIFTALQLYALHQQGRSETVHYEYSKEKSEEGIEENDEHKGKGDIGSAFRLLRMEADSSSLDRRFNSMLTSSNVTELKNHLRHLISILKAKTSEKIDYAKLAKDLYFFQTKSRQQVLLGWGRNYYRIGKSKQD